MSKVEKFSVIIGSPKQLELGSIVKQEDKILCVTSIRKVECIMGNFVLVSGEGKLEWQSKK